MKLKKRLVKTMEKPVRNVFDHFKDFYENKAIKQIQDIPLWTVSQKSDKKPINIKEYLATNAIYGCNNPSTQCLTLRELTTALPNINNAAFYLDALRDELVVLDIEPECPDELRQKFLNMPYLYGETSMSGKGIHLVFPLPDEIYDYPDALNKVVFKDKNGYYEILLNHWVTFTRNTKPIPPPDNTESFVELFVQMASKQKIYAKSDVEINLSHPDIPDQFEIVRSIVKGRSHNKTLLYYRNDVSRYESGITGFYYQELRKRLLHPQITKNGHTYTDNERVWLLYDIIKQTIPYRSKHDGERNNMPWLLYLAKSIYSLNKAKEEREDL